MHYLQMGNNKNADECFNIPVYRRTSRSFIGSSFLKTPFNYLENLSGICEEELYKCYVRFEVFTAVTIKNGVFWDITLCGSCKNRRFGGT
jgi:hypothetical protein